MAVKSSFNYQKENVTKFKGFKSILLHLGLFVYLSRMLCEAERIFPGNPYSHREILDTNGKFLIEWIADPRKPDVIFNITAETRGYVAIGLSKTGKMAKSDIVFAGVDRGIPYISDRFTRHDKRVPMEDIQQSWKLLRAWENRTHTSVRISRNKDTCDPQDYVISDNTMYLLWAFGEDDAVDYHFQNRGSVPIHLLQPDLTPEVPSQNTTNNSSKPQPTLDVWRLTVTVNNVKSGGSWCVFQKGPELPTMLNIIGFSTPVADENLRKYLDRVVIYKCLPSYGISSNPKNQSSMEEIQAEIERLDEYSGECSNATELFSFCKNIIYTWAMGGKDVFLPKNTGVPFGGVDEYYLLESFLIPPQSKENQIATAIDSSSSEDSIGAKRDEEFDIHTDILLTDSPRKFEAKIMKIGYDPLTPLLLPSPISKDFEVFGHCPNECTSRFIPKRKPLRLFGVSFDTGPFGKRVTLHHLRNAFEIPIILHDGNYNPTFQQMQILPLETPVRQGDQLTVRCKYKNAMMYGDFTQYSVHNNSLNSSETQVHRCLAYLWYYQEKSNSSSTQSNSQHQVFECTSKIHPGDFTRFLEDIAPIEIRRNIGSPQLLDKLRRLKWSGHLQLSLFELYELGRYRSSCGGMIQQRHAHPANDTNKIGSKLNRNRGNITNSGGLSGASGEITVYPLPVEDIPSTIGCPTLDSPLLVSPPGPVIFGFP